MNDNIKLREKAASGVIWQLLERIGARGVALVVTIILARLLEPDVYGVVALATVFTDFLHPFINSGMGTALIQKKETDTIDFSTYFFFNLASGIILYFILWLFAPYIAIFYNNEQICLILRIIGLNLVIYSVKAVQIYYVSRNLLFKKFFWSTLAGTVGAAVLGVWMAYNGYGVWALVVQNLFNNLIDTIILWFTVKWRPKFVFSIERLKKLLSFGWKILLVNVTNTIVDKIRALLIGKVYTTTDLAFYNKGDLFPDVVNSSIESALNGVLLPTLSTKQDDPYALKSMLKRYIKTITYILLPINLGLIVCSKPLIRIILTEKWLPAVPFLIVFSIQRIIGVLNSSNQSIYSAIGKPELYLRIDIIKKVIVLSLMLIGLILYGILGIAVSSILAGIFNYVINSFQNKRLINYGIFDQLSDIKPNFNISVIMATTVYFVQKINISDLYVLIIQIILGISLYLILSIAFKNENFYYLLSLIKRMIKSC